MANSSIQEIFQQFQSEFDVTPDGQVNSSVRGTARLANISENAIRSSLKTAQRSPSSLAKFLMEQGFEAAQLESWLKIGVPDVAVALILEYYGYEAQPRYQKEQARLVCRSFRAIGFRQWVKQQKGYQIEQQAPQTYLEALKALVQSEEEKERLRLERQELQEENQQLSETMDEMFDYSSIIRVAKYNGVSEKNFNWRPLKRVTQNMGLEVKKVPDPRFGAKNLYPHDAWRYCYPDYSLPETTTLTIY